MNILPGWITMVYSRSCWKWEGRENVKEEDQGISGYRGKKVDNDGNNTEIKIMIRNREPWRKWVRKSD